MIKFYNLDKIDKPLNKKILSSIKSIISKKNFINGDEIDLFEKKFSKLCKTKYAIACSNGTDALTLALKSLNLKKDSEVIIPAMTYISTALAVFNANLKPVLVDIDPLTALMDIDLLKKKISKKTRVIMPVHLYGNIFNNTELKKILKTKKNKIYLIDDCSQAHGAYEYFNTKKTFAVGSNSDISCFSLYPGKNLGAYGDAGIITTNSKKTKNKITRLGNIGLMRSEKYEHNIIANNNRLDTIQAAILNQKIKLLDRYNLLRKKIAYLYTSKIKNKKIIKINYSKGAVYHQYIVLVKNRKKFIKYMEKNNIQTGLHYPKSINKQKCLNKFFNNQEFINAEYLAGTCVSLPIDPTLNKKTILKIISIINNY